MVQKTNIFGHGIIGDGKAVPVKSAPEPVHILKKDYNIHPTTGQIQILAQADEQIDSEVFAGEKTKEIGEIEKIDKRIQMMQREIKNQKMRLD
jgi:hypothetical protein